MLARLSKLCTFMATSFWSMLFSCCVRQRSDSDVAPHERSPLIPVADEVPIPQPRAIDHQKLKERLITVVRSKEGRMVNVNSQFPFNLHNQVLGEPSSSRSTRSVSGGTANDSRQRSPSPRRVIQKSYSSTSLRQHLDNSSLNLLGELDDDPDARKPILNVKLVQGAAHIGAPRGGQARGRGRFGRFGEEGGRWVRAAITEPELEKGEVPTAAVSDSEPGHEGVEDGTPRAHTALEQEHSSGLQAGSSDSSIDASVPQSEDFTIHDAGAISCSWGD